MNKKTVRVFRYLDDLDCFVVGDEYRQLADQLGLTEWSPVVWIGRLFVLDKDFGEHWFDKRDLREALAEEAAQRGLPEEELLIIDPERLQDGRDGPCHSPESASASGPTCCARWS